MILCVGNAAISQATVTITKTIESQDKSWEQISATLGDILCVKLVVCNPYGGPVLVVDNLGSACTYMAETCKLDGISLTPAVHNNKISLPVGPGEHEITYKFQVVQVEAYNMYINCEACICDPDSNPESKDSIRIQLCRYPGLFKWLWCSSHDPMALPLGENIVWVMDICVRNEFCFTMKDLVVTDNLAAEFEVDEWWWEVDDWWPTADMKMKIRTKGNSKKVTWTWTIGDLDPSQKSPLLKFLISTDLNPAGKQEFTSPGCYELNSGVVIKFKDPMTGNQLSAHTGPVFAVNVGTP